LNVSDYADRRVWKRAISTATLVVAESSRHNPAVGMMTQDVHPAPDFRPPRRQDHPVLDDLPRERRAIVLAEHPLAPQMSMLGERRGQPSRERHVTLPSTLRRSHLSVPVRTPDT
jgi:hypothetical protein